VCVCARASEYVCVCVRAQVSMCVCVCVCVCVCLNCNAVSGVNLCHVNMFLARALVCVSMRVHVRLMRRYNGICHKALWFCVCLLLLFFFSME
jgi:hypothetical protein